MAFIPAWRVIACIAAVSFSAQADVPAFSPVPAFDSVPVFDASQYQEPLPSSISWIDHLRLTPLFRFFTPLVPLQAVFDSISPLDIAEVEVAQESLCEVEPLPRISDLEAISFEYDATSAINIEGLTPTTALALTRFKRAVSSVGGMIILTSAYRPTAYQEHLQAVWDKWMLELRNNNDEHCRELKAEVEEEFKRHQLLVRQRPAPFSDHSLGIAFDASILLPKSARWKRRRTSIDALARTAGIRRPYRSLDPVHFRIAKM